MTAVNKSSPCCMHMKCQHKFERQESAWMMLLPALSAWLMLLPALPQYNELHVDNQPNRAGVIRLSFRDLKSSTKKANGMVSAAL